MRVRLHYTWPDIRKDVKAHVDQCKLCAELMPSKSQARSSGLNIPIESLKPMDWLSTDLAVKTLSNGKKVNFLLIVDRASGFIKVYQLRGTKTRNVIEALQEFNDTYVGPPYWLTLDGGPQFSGANAAIKKWAEGASIKHTKSAAFNPEGNGEAERAVQSAKKAISHCKGGSNSIQSIVANLNHDQRVDGSGSAAEIFLQRTCRVPGLAHLPAHPRDIEQLRSARASSRDRQVQATQSQRKPEVFTRGQRVLVQNNLSKLWNIKAKVLSRRSHQGIESNSYLLHVPSTGRQMVRSERNIRQVAGARTNPSGANPDLGTEGLASAVLRTSVSLPCKPSSILKRTAHSGETT